LDKSQAHYEPAPSEQGVEAMKSPALISKPHFIGQDASEARHEKCHSVKLKGKGLMRKGQVATSQERFKIWLEEIKKSLR
jgi:hypothetical protein